MRNATGVAITLLLAACVAPLPKPPAPPAPAPVAPLTPTPAPATPPDTNAPDGSAATQASDSPWPRLRRRFAMRGCDYREDVQRWAHYYTAQPRQFAASWKRAMPFLLLVLDEIEQRDLPGEFAMLPYVESTYEPVPSNGDRPAGMWQLVPDTARSAGLAIAPDYDERLDAVASTHATLDLLEHYEREFGDWRLVNMAFNSGEFRVRKLLGERDARALSAAELGSLPFSAGTHEHLDRLLALSCIVDDPARFKVNLPEPQPRDRLHPVTLEAGMDLRVAAHLADLPVDDVQRWNAAHRRHRMADAAPHRLLLPEERVAGFTAATRAIPPALWPDWRERRAERTSRLASWAAESGIAVDALAAANGVGVDTTIASTSRLLLPGREPEPVEAPAAKSRAARVHVVAAGDTLSRIAHKYSVSLRDLKRWNPRAGGTLRLGERLRLALPEGGS